MENKLIFAKEIIKEAGAFIKESLSKTITVEEKTAFDDLVTNIDKQTQDLLVARIKSSFPSDNIFAEENGLVHNILLFALRYHNDRRCRLYLFEFLQGF